MGWLRQLGARARALRALLGARARALRALLGARVRELRARRRARRGRILAAKLGYNPNSSSLGVDVTFLLFGMAAIAVLTPIIGLILRARRARELLTPRGSRGGRLPDGGQSAPASRES